MNIVFLDADTLGNDMSFDIFHELGNVTIYGETKRDQAKERIKDADIVLCNKSKMNAENLEGVERLKLICVTATGTNNIDFDYVNKRGIAVTNVSGYSTDSVAQHTFAMLFYLVEKLHYFDDYVKSGKYALSPMFTHLEEKFFQIKNKTWGIVGLGAIGRKVAEIAEVFGCNVIYYSTSGKNQDSHFKSVDWDSLLVQSDIISIHAPLNDNTYQLFTLDVFRKMKQEAILLNLGRGGIVKEDDLVQALNDNVIQAAGLDVLSKEPLPEDSPLMQIKDSKRLFITPHIAWGSVEARSLLIKELYLNIVSFTKGEERNRCYK